MTFEELKEEASKMGYSLVKKPPKMPKLLKCPMCGRIPKVRYSMYGPDANIYVSCPSNKCIKGPRVYRNDGYNNVKPKAEAEYEAREAWNKMIEESNFYGEKH